jgi:Fe-S cluster assembly protein SufB
MQQEEPNKMKPNQKDELEKKTDNEFVRKFAEEKYKYGFTTEVHTDIIERGLNEDVIRLISSKKDEPEWLLEFRLSVPPLADAGDADLGTSPYP